MAQRVKSTPSKTAAPLRDASSSPNRNWGLGTSVGTWASIFLAAIMAYWPALRGGMVWDDDAHITSSAMQSLHGLWRIWFELGATQQYYPLLHSAFWVEHRLWGDAVLGYHLANLAQHALSACLVVLIVRQLKLPGAWLAGLIFALHPVCVESVAWISEQKSTLSGVFYLAAMLAYLHFDESRKTSKYFAALGLFVLALLSKSVTATLPAVLLVLFWWERGRLDWKRDIAPLLPWFVIGASAGLFTAWVEKTYIGAQGANFELSLLQHLLLAGRVLCFYAGKAMWPVDLMFSYPHWQLDPTVAWQYLYPLAVTAVAAGFFILAMRRNRGPLAAFLIFAGTLFPVLGLFHVFPFKYSYVADHFQYLAILAIVIPAACLLTQNFPRVSSNRNVSFAAAILLLLVLGTLTWRQSSVYRDSETLYRATLELNPDSWMTHNNLGIVLASDPGRLAEAATEFRSTLRIYPEHAKAHMNLGNILAQTGKLPEAIAEYQTSLRFQPNYAPAHADLGIAYTQIPGRMPDAIAEFQASVRLQPHDAAFHQWLAFALSRTPGRLADAIAEYQAAIRFQPGNPDLHMNLGDTLANFPERRQEAIAEFETVLRIQPNSQPAREAIERLNADDRQPHQ